MKLDKHGRLTKKFYLELVRLPMLFTYKEIYCLQGITVISITLDSPGLGLPQPSWQYSHSPPVKMSELVITFALAFNSANDNLCMINYFKIFILLCSHFTKKGKHERVFRYPSVSEAKRSTSAGVLFFFLSINMIQR